MATLSISRVGTTTFRFRISDLQYEFTSSYYTAVGLSINSFTDGTSTMPSSIWSGTVGSDISENAGYYYTPYVTISHGLSAGTYTIYAWARLATNGRYYAAGSTTITIEAEEEETTYYYYGGYGGGPAVGSDGYNGTGTRSSQIGGDGADAAVDGADADYGGSSSATYYGYGNGGGGGHGGGGGGGGGYNTSSGGASPGSGGLPSDGGEGAPGCILFYY